MLYSYLFVCVCVLLSQIDAIGTKRFDSELSGDREVQRTMLELLSQLDGFTSSDDVKVGGTGHTMGETVHTCALIGCARAGLGLDRRA